MSMIVTLEADRLKEKGLLQHVDISTNTTGAITSKGHRDRASNSIDNTCIVFGHLSWTFFDLVIFQWYFP